MPINRLIPSFLVIYNQVWLSKRRTFELQKRIEMRTWDFHIRAQLWLPPGQKLPKLCRYWCGMNLVVTAHCDPKLRKKLSRDGPKNGSLFLRAACHIKEKAGGSSTGGGIWLLSVDGRVPSKSWNVNKFHFFYKWLFDIVEFISW